MVKFIPERCRRGRRYASAEPALRSCKGLRERQWPLLPAIQNGPYNLCVNLISCKCQIIPGESNTRLASKKTPTSFSVLRRLRGNENRQKRPKWVQPASTFPDQCAEQKKKFPSWGCKASKGSRRDYGWLHPVTRSPANGSLAMSTGTWPLHRSWRLCAIFLAWQHVIV
jgi:hypothetical protein